MIRLRNLAMIGIGLVLALVIASCAVSQPSGVPSDDAINTSVAATINAQSQVTALPPATAEPAVPTRIPTEAPVLADVPASSPLIVAFVSPDKNAYTWNESLSVPVQLTTSGDVQEAIVSPDGCGWCSSAQQIGLPIHWMSSTRMVLTCAPWFSLPASMHYLVQQKLSPPPPAR